MDKFLRVLAYLTFGFAALSVAFDASAAIEVAITDGKTIIWSGNPRTGFKLSKPSSPGYDDVMLLLQCGTPPCTIYFPSGGEGFTTGDTFVFRDSASGPARIEKYDSGAPRLELKGVQVTALAEGAGKTLTVSFRSADFAVLPADDDEETSSTYPAAVLYKGYFTKAGAAEHAEQCWDPNAKIPPDQMMNYCSKVLLKGNGSTRPGSGAAELSTVSVPCQDYAGSPSPCKGDLYLHSGRFERANQGDITCPYPCTPDQEETVTTTFKTEGQMLSLDNSVTAAMARHTVEKFGVEELYHSLAGKLGKPVWVNFAAGEEVYRTKPPTKEAKVSDLVVPIAFDLFQGRFTSGKPISLTSIMTFKGNGDDALPFRERIRNNRSYVSFIATPNLKFKAVESLVLAYNVVVAEKGAPDLRLPPLKFADCPEATFYVRINLTEAKNKDLGYLIVNLGSEPPFTTRCAEAKLTGVDLFQEGKPRVDDTNLGGKELLSLKQARDKYANRLVRSISVVAEQRGDAPANLRIDLSEALVGLSGNAQFKASTFWRVVEPDSFAPVSRLPPDGVSLIFSRADLSPAQPVYVVGNSQIERVGSQLLAKVATDKLPMDPNPAAKYTKYRIDLCLSAGRCIPSQGTLTLWK